jgi:DNA-binding response OmpR family regulator
MERSRLLVVEDESGIRELLAAGLRFAGFQVDTAVTGAEALRHVERQRPEAVPQGADLPDRVGRARPAGRRGVLLLAAQQELDGCARACRAGHLILLPLLLPLRWRYRRAHSPPRTPVR